MEGAVLISASCSVYLKPLRAIEGRCSLLGKMGNYAREGKKGKRPVSFSLRRGIPI